MSGILLVGALEDLEARLSSGERRVLALPSLVGAARFLRLASPSVVFVRVDAQNVEIACALIDFVHRSTVPVFAVSSDSSVRARCEAMGAPEIPGDLERIAAKLATLCAPCGTGPQDHGRAWTSDY